MEEIDFARLPQSVGKSPASTIQDFFSHIAYLPMEDVEMPGRSDPNSDIAPQSFNGNNEEWRRPNSLADATENPVEIMFSQETNGRSIRKCVARSPYVPEEILDTLAMDGSTSVQVAVASNLNTSPSTMTLLARVGGQRVKRALAANPHATLRTFNILAAENGIFIRIALAENIATSPSLLNYLAKDRNWRVRKRVAANISTPVGALMRLSVDRRYRVREQAIQNPSLPSKMPRNLASLHNIPWTASEAIRFSEPASSALTLLSNLTHQTMEQVRRLRQKVLLVRTSSRRNFRGAEENNFILGGSADESSTTLPDYPVSNAPRPPTMPNPEPTTSVHEKTFEVDTPLTSHHSANLDPLEQGIDKGELPPLFLLFKDLATNHSVQIRKSVATHYYTPTSVLELLSLDPVARVRLEIARNPQVPSSILTRLVRDANRKVREAVASNRNCSTDILNQLLGDKNWRVRGIARANLSYRKISEDENYKRL